MTDILRKLDGREVSINDIIHYDAETNTVDLRADVFIIPNSAPRMSEILEFAQAEMREFAERFNSCNGKTFNEKYDNFVECWITSGCNGWGDDFNSAYTFSDGEHIYRFGGIRRYIMSNYLIDYKEGETTIFDIEHFIMVDDKKVECKVHMHLTLNQLDYRYRRFGNFQEVLSLVCR